MIQRIQTLYFLAIIVLAVVTCTGVIIDYHTQVKTVTEQGSVTDSTAVGAKAVVYTLNGLYFKTYENGVEKNSEIQYGLILIVSIIVGWTLNIILGYKNRKKQMLHTKINFALIGMYLLAVLGKAFTQIPDFNFAGMTLKASIGMAFIIFMLYLNMRAFLLIRKDEELVKSADRLR